MAADLTSDDGTTRLLGALDGVQIDLLINNAGSGAVGPFLHRPMQPNLQSVRLNIDALLTLTHSIGGDMVARGGGGIINVASTAAFQPMPYQSSYAATKAFVLSFTEPMEARSLRIPVAHRPVSRPGQHESSLESHSPGSSGT